jgi:hypothetical protein
VTLRTVFLSCLLLASGLTRAAGFYDSLPDIDFSPQHSSLWLEYTNGANVTEDGYAELDLVVAGDQHLIFGAGQTRVGSGNTRFNLESYSLGWNSAYGAPFETGLRFDVWGDPAELRTRSLALPLRWNHATWGFSLEPRFSWIDTYTRTLLNQRRQLDTRSQALKAGLDWYGESGWELLLEGSHYNYADDVSRLDSPLARFLLSEVTLSLSRGLPKQSLALEIGYRFDTQPGLRLGLRREHVVSAVDGSGADVSSIKLNLDPIFGDLTSRLGLYLEAGRLQADTSPDADYLKLGTQLGF